MLSRHNFLLVSATFMMVYKTNPTLFVTSTFNSFTGVHHTTVADVLDFLVAKHPFVRFESVLLANVKVQTGVAMVDHKNDAHQFQDTEEVRTVCSDLCSVAKFKHSSVS